MIYLEDLEVGRKASFGSYHVTREEVLAFARQYDAQPFHLSDEAAAQTHFGRIAASGWHTCAMTMAMIVENLGRPAWARPAWTSSAGLSRSIPATLCASRARSRK